MPEGWEEFTGNEVRWALAETRNAADAMLELAYALEVRLPGTREAFRTGVLRRSKAEIIARATDLLDPAEARAAEALVLDRAGRLSPGGLCAGIARAVIEVAPDKARKRREVAVRDGRVERWGEDSGNAALAGRELPLAEVLAADQRSNANAGTAAGSARRRTGRSRATRPWTSPGMSGPPSCTRTAPAHRTAVAARRRRRLRRRGAVVRRHPVRYRPVAAGMRDDDGPTSRVGLNVHRAEFRASDADGRPVDPATEGDTQRSERVWRLQDRWTPEAPSAEPADVLREWIAASPANLDSRETVLSL